MSLCACGCRSCSDHARPIHESVISRGLAKPFDGTHCQCCDQLWCANCGKPIPGTATHTPCCGKDLRYTVVRPW